MPQPGLNGRRGFQPRGQVLGGSSSINAMVYTRGNRLDYDHWAALGNPGWGFDDVLPYFKRAENSECFGANAFHGSGGPLNVSHLPNPRAFSMRRFWPPAPSRACRQRRTTTAPLSSVVARRK